MDIDALDPSLRDATLKLPKSDPSSGLARALARVFIPLMPAHRTPGVAVRRVRDGRVRVRVFTPEGAPAPRPALLWIHGGGYVLGAARIDDRICGETAAALGITVVSAEYRLAPRHPFPAALDDVTACWDWLVGAAAGLGIDPARLAIGGQSAGGGLAATLAQRLRERGDVQPVAQWLFCPMLDDRTAADGSLDQIDHVVWPNASNRFGWSAYLGAAPGAVSAPAFAVAARAEDLSGLPATWADAGSIELFRPEIEAYVARLRAAGVPAELDIVPGAPHGFETWAADTEPARQLRARARAWLAARFGRESSESPPPSDGTRPIGGG